MKQILLLVALFLLPFATQSKEDVLSILNFKDIKIPDDYFEKPTTTRTDLEPFTCDDLETLLKKKVGSETLRNMVKSRGTSCNPGAENLGKLKDAGADDKLIAGISEYALSPNETLNLVIEMNFLGYEPAPVKGSPFFHIVLAGKKPKPVTAIASLDDIVASKWTFDTVESYKDGILEKKVRKIALLIPFKFREWGKSTLYVLQNKSGVALKGKQVKTMPGVKNFELDYPKFSRRAVCDLEIDLTHNVALKGKWEIKEADFDCDWGM